MTTPDVLLPQSFAVQALAFGMAIGIVLGGLLALLWSHDVTYRRGYSTAWPRAHRAGFQDGLRESGVLDRLVALDERQSLQADAEFRREANERRHRAALAAWREELGRHG